jgi:hypothetical protein
MIRRRATPKSLPKKSFLKIFIGSSTKNSFPQNHIIPQQIPNNKLPNISKFTTSSRGPLVGPH